MNCPRCETPLSVRPLSDVAMHECKQCGGLFLAHRTIERIVEGQGGTLLANELLASLPRAKTSPTPPPGQRMYVKCPTCGTLMNRKQFATGAGIVLDVCKRDGAFFDAGELPAVVEFVMRGGLETAARKDAARAHDARRAAQNARRDVPIWNQATVPDELDAGVALVDLLLTLFS